MRLNSVSVDASFALVCEFIPNLHNITHFNKINSSINPQAAKAEIVSQDFSDWGICLEQTREPVPGRIRTATQTISQFIAIVTDKNILTPGNPDSEIMGQLQGPDSPKL